jgi:hypothetical protein
MDRLIIEPMGKDLLIWRCLHGGPLSARNIDEPAPNPVVDWAWARARNVPLLKKLVETYGSSAIVARDGDAVVATLRFYPKSLCEFSAEGGAAFCLQQPYPAGPADDRAARRFPRLQDLADKTLFVHCMLILSPRDEPGRYRRHGLATRMAQELVRWARERGWAAIEATAYEDIPFLYAIAGVAGKMFWEKLGFRVVISDQEPAMTGPLLEDVRQSALAAGIPAEKAANRYRMRLELAGG